jgi:hypothetical protein
MLQNANLPVLPLNQPWASWCFTRPTPCAPPVKLHETRTRRWHHRGWFAIHANAGLPDAFNIARGNKAIAAAVGHPLAVDFPTGAIIGIACLADCQQMTPSLIAAQTPLELAMGHWLPCRYALRLTGATRFSAPIPFKAHQGVNRWVPPPDITDLIRELSAAHDGPPPTAPARAIAQLAARA